MNEHILNEAQVNRIHDKLVRIGTPFPVKEIEQAFQFNVERFTNRYGYRPRFRFEDEFAEVEEGTLNTLDVSLDDYYRSAG